MRRAKMQAKSQSATASEVFESLNVGDVIRVPQYESSLRVNHDGRQVGMLGVEFADTSREGAPKRLIQNEHSGRIYLVAGASDKGEVESIEVVA